jgi:hypothetical protein
MGYEKVTGRPHPALRQRKLRQIESEGGSGGSSSGIRQELLKPRTYQDDITAKFDFPSMAGILHF